MINNQPNIVVIGGGTGSFTVLQAVKGITDNVSAIVAMVDNGGSTGRLRDQYGVLPAGDIRQCLLALSNNFADFRELLTYRFPDGDLKGHNSGNIMLAALEQSSKDFDDAVLKASKIFNIVGDVIPVTKDSTSLVMHDGQRQIFGQRQIDDSNIENEKPSLALEPKVKINPRARDKLLQADYIIFSPGSLYDSIISSLIVNGVTEAIDSSNAKLIQIVNLVTKPGHTDGWLVADYITELNRFLGQKKIDLGLYNTEIPTTDMLDQYLKDNEIPVKVGVEAPGGVRLYGSDMIAKYEHGQYLNDALIKERTLIRHDMNALKELITKVIREN